MEHKIKKIQSMCTTHTNYQLLFNLLGGNCVLLNVILIFIPTHLFYKAFPSKYWMHISTTSVKCVLVWFILLLIPSCCASWTGTEKKTQGVNKEREFILPVFKKYNHSHNNIIVLMFPFFLPQFYNDCASIINLF